MITSICYCLLAMTLPYQPFRNVYLRSDSNSRDFFHCCNTFQCSNFSLDVFFCLQVVERLTRGLVETYKTCNPQFKYRGELNPKRYLTTPSAGVLNDGFDNVNSDLILAVNDDLSSSDSRQRFAILLVIFNFHFSDTLPSFVVLLEA